MTLSFWEQTLDPLCKERLVSPASEIPAECPFLICGGGLSGVSLSYHLAERGISSVLLESQTLGGGASGRNGGILWPSSDWLEKKTYEELISLFEKEARFSSLGALRFRSGGSVLSDSMRRLLEDSHVSLFGISDLELETASAVSGAELVLAIAARSKEMVPSSRFFEHTAIKRFERRQVIKVVGFLSKHLL